MGRSVFVFVKWKDNLKEKKGINVCIKIEVKSENLESIPFYTATMCILVKICDHLVTFCPSCSYFIACVFVCRCTACVRHRSQPPHVSVGEDQHGSQPTHRMHLYSFNISLYICFFLKIYFAFIFLNYALTCAHFFLFIPSLSP